MQYRACEDAGTRAQRYVLQAHATELFADRPQLQLTPATTIKISVKNTKVESS